jgi:hypothetical protein
MGMDVLGSVLLNQVLHVLLKVPALRIAVLGHGIFTTMSVTMETQLRVMGAMLLVTLRTDTTATMETQPMITIHVMRSAETA